VRRIDFARDDLGRVLSTRLNSGVDAKTGWNGNSFITSVTPPGKPAHGQNPNSINLLGAYVPPPIPQITQSTYYNYNTDHQLTQTIMPNLSGNRSIINGYNLTTGQLAQITTYNGTVTADETLGLTYLLASGNLSSISVSGRQGLSFEYDGSLTTKVQWTAGSS